MPRLRWQGRSRPQGQSVNILNKYLGMRKLLATFTNTLWEHFKSTSAIQSDSILDELLKK